MKIAKKRNVENILIGAVLVLWSLVVFAPQLVMEKNSESADSSVVFDDDFTASSYFSKWPRLKPTENSKDVMWSANGAYRMYNPSSAAANLLAQAPQPHTIGDASVEVDATRISDDVGEYALWGVFCRATITKGNLYLLGIHNDGSPVIAKYDNNEVSILARDTPTDAVSKDMSTNHIRGDCVGSKLTLYVNDQKLLETKDAEFASGGVGLAVESADISFDNFLVSEP